MSKGDNLFLSWFVICLLGFAVIVHLYIATQDVSVVDTTLECCVQQIAKGRQEDRNWLVNRKMWTSCSVQDLLTTLAAIAFLSSSSPWRLFQADQQNQNQRAICCLKLVVRKEVYCCCTVIVKWYTLLDDSLRGPATLQEMYSLAMIIVDKLLFKAGEYFSLIVSNISRIGMMLVICGVCVDLYMPPRPRWAW